MFKLFEIKMSSSVTTRQADEAKRKIKMIGEVSHQIVGAKLPSNRQVLDKLELVLTFLGGDGGAFRACGGTSHARFMSKCIYSLKMFLFREHFKPFTKNQLKSIREICIFVVKFYIKFWFGCTNAIKSPNQDLQFIREAFQYENIDKKVSKALIDKIMNHLWYLSPEKIALSFFDSNVSYEVKRKMVKQLKVTNPVVSLLDNRKHSNLKELVKCDLSDFVSYRTNFFFQALNSKPIFLNSIHPNGKTMRSIKLHSNSVKIYLWTMMPQSVV